MIPRSLVLGSLIAAILLPVVVAILYGVATLLAALGDISGAAGVGRVALACGVLWGVDLIGLVLLLATAAVLSGMPAQRDEVRQPLGELPPEEPADEE